MKCALIGCGYWGSKMKRYIEANPIFDLVAVCNSKSDLEKEAFNEEVQAVFIATRNDSHFRIAEVALNKGKHVLVEKPMALTGANAAYLVDKARKKRVTLMTDYVFTFSKSLKMAQKLIDEGEIGELKFIDLSSKHLGRFKGGGVYWLLASHWLAVTDMFTPINSMEWTRDDHMVTDEVESGSLIGVGENVKSKIDVSLNHPFKEVWCNFYGSEGTITYDPTTSTENLKLCRYKKTPWTIRNELDKNFRTYSYDEANNIGLAVEAFAEAIKRRDGGNMDRSLNVTRILERSRTR